MLDGNGDTVAMIDMGAYEYGNLSAQCHAQALMMARCGCHRGRTARAASVGHAAALWPVPSLDFAGKAIALGSTGTIPLEDASVTELPAGASLRARVSLPILIGGTLRTQQWRPGERDGRINPTGGWRTTDRTAGIGL